MGINPCGCVVDVLRSCYRSQMNFFSDCTVPTTVRWYFTEPGAAAMPFPTAFASSNWENEWSWNGPIGENQQLYTHAWSNGHTPRSVNGQRPCGTADQFANGFPKNTFAPALNWPLPVAPATSLLWGSNTNPGLIMYDSQSIPLCCGNRNAPAAGSLRWGRNPAAFGALQLGDGPEVAGSLALGAGELPEGSLALGLGEFSPGSWQLGIGTLPEGSLAWGTGTLPAGSWQLGIGTLPEGSLAWGIGKPSPGAWQLGTGEVPAGSLALGLVNIPSGALVLGVEFGVDGSLQYGIGILPAGSVAFGYNPIGSLMWGNQHG